MLKQGTKRETLSSMYNLQKIGGIAALYLAAAYLVGMEACHTTQSVPA